MADENTTEPTTEELLQQWKLWKDRTAFAQEKERALRSQLCAKHFPTPKEGTNKVELDFPERVVELKMVYPYDRKLDDGQLAALIKEVREKAANPDHPLHALSTVNFDKLVKRKPELAVKEYRGLSDVQKPLFDTVMTTKPGSPQLSFTVKPKEA